MAAYLIAERKIADQRKMDEYVRLIVPMLERYGAKYLTKTEDHHQVLAGNWQPDRVVLIEFPDMATLRKWFDSAEYRPLDALRRASGEEVLIAIDGIKAVTPA